MGTVSRTGLPGLFMGNTAETILQSVSCSVLVVKPEGFGTPVKLGRSRHFQTAAKFLEPLVHRDRTWVLPTKRQDSFPNQPRRSHHLASSRTGEMVRDAQTAMSQSFSDNA